MSNLPVVIPTTDMTELEMAKVVKFKEEGLPGVANVTNTQLHRMLDLYLNGSTYTQIASILQLKKVVILYFAHSSNWFETKQEYLSEIQEKIKNRVVDAKLRNHEFMLLLVQAWQKKIGKNLHKFLSTEEPEHMEDLDLKEVAQLMKAIDMVNELDSAGKTPSGKTPAVGLNVGQGVTIEKVGDNKVSITPNEPTTIGSILQGLADERRDKEKEKK